LQCCYHLY